MQKKNKNKTKKSPLVFKPYLRGRAASALAARRGVRVLGYTALFAFLYVLAGSALSFDNTLLRVLCNGVLVVTCGLIMYADGSRQGEGDTSFAEIAHKRASEGRDVPAVEAARCFHPLKGFFTVLVGMSPLLILCVINALTAQRQSYSLGVLPSWVSAYERQAQIGPALAYYNETSALGFVDIVRVIVRIAIFPFINMVGARNYDMMLLCDRISPLLCLLAPALYGVGYLRGPVMRAQIHGSIRTSLQKSKRRAQKERQQRAQQMKRKQQQKKELI